MSIKELHLYRILHIKFFYLIQLQRMGLAYLALNLVLEPTH